MTTVKLIHVREKLNNITECSICTETYSDPRVLPCIHTYCLKCIKTFSQNKRPGACVSCPLCRKDFVVPEHGIDNLPKNFFIEQLKDLTQASSNHCEGCGDTSGKKQAIKYCTECQQKFCEACVNVHGKMKLSQGHIVLEIGEDGKVPESVGKILSLHCDKHLNETLKLYCFDCNEVICMVCFATSHKSHECSEIDKVSEDFRSQMTGDIQNMSKTAKECCDLVKEQERERDDLNNVVSGIEKKICDIAEKMKKMIDSEKLKLMHELSTFKADRMKQVQHVIENIEQHAQFADSLAKYMEELRNKGTASAVAQQTRALHNRVNELTKLDHIQLEMNDLGSIEVTFDAVKVSTEATGQLLGRITWQRVNVVQSTTLKQVAIIADDRRRVVGVTSIHSQLFVLRNPSQQEIKVYDLKLFKQQQTIQLIDLHDYISDSGLTSCVTNNCLYVSDWYKTTVYKVDLMTSDNKNKVIKWRVGRAPCGLSINSVCNLLVACFDYKIQEYNTTSGSLVREISLELKGIKLNPLHVMQLTNDQFVVSCITSYYNETSQSHDVVEVDTKRHRVVSYTKQVKSTTRREFLWPRHLSVDKNNERILVADTDNNRIVILNRSLKCDARELNVMMTVHGGLHEPRCLYFNSSQNRVFVGEYGGQCRVLVFDNVI